MLNKNSTVAREEAKVLCNVPVSLEAVTFVKLYDCLIKKKEIKH